MSNRVEKTYTFLRVLKKIIIIIFLCLVVLLLAFIGIDKLLYKIGKNDYIGQSQDYSFVDEAGKIYTVEYVDSWEYDYYDSNPGFKWFYDDTYCVIYDEMNLIGQSKRYSNTLGSNNYVEYNVKSDFYNAEKIYDGNDNIKIKSKFIKSKFKEEFFTESFDKKVYIYASDNKEKLLAKIVNSSLSYKYITNLYEDGDIGIYQVGDYIAYRFDNEYGQVYIGDKVNFDKVYPKAKDACRLLLDKGNLDRIKIDSFKSAEDVLNDIIKSDEHHIEN